MQSAINLTNNGFTELHNGTGGAIISVSSGTIGIHVGSGTPDGEALLTFVAGDKWIIPAGNQVRARSVSTSARVVVASLASA